MGEESDSVYSLITKLCEKFTGRLEGSFQKHRKRLRSKCYAILLSKCELEQPNGILVNNNDPLCHLLAWQFMLKTEWNFPRHAEKLAACIDKLEKCCSLDNESLKTILFFLLQLRQIPEEDDSLMDRTVNFKLQAFPTDRSRSCSVISLNLDETRFKLPNALLCRDFKYSNESFRLNTKPKTSKRKYFSRKEDPSCHFLYKPDNCSCLNSVSRISCRSIIDEKVPNEIALKSPVKTESFLSDSESVWELALKAGLEDKHKTWEAYGCAYPDKEPPFLTELNDPGIMIKYLSYLQCIHDRDTKVGMEWNVFSQQDFIRDVKYLLVGTVSKTFELNDRDEFVLVPGILVDGFTRETLRSYCHEFVACGSCYKALFRLVSSKEHGREICIFKQFCASVRRYLSLYRITVLSQQDTVSPLVLKIQVGKLQQHLNCLASVCRIGPYKGTEKMPRGVDLLNYLYDKIMSLTHQNSLMVLYSVFYSCCQVYFSRYLHGWIFEGNLNDPYDEFFIKPNLKYISTRGRLYWTRSYVLRENLVPTFLYKIRNDILLCGKAMNLLKFCAPTSKLRSYLMSRLRGLVTCCLTKESLTDLERKLVSYNLVASVECGPLFSLTEMLQKTNEENPEFFELVSKKRAATLKRIELEKIKKLQIEAEKKAEEMRILKEQYDIALQQKQKRLALEMEQDIAIAEKDMEMRKIRDKLIEDEARRLTDHYATLCELSEQRRQRILQHTQTLRSIHLESPRSDIHNQTPPTSESPDPEENALETRTIKSATSNESFRTADDDIDVSDATGSSSEHEPTELHTSRSLDVINANVEQQPQETTTTKEQQEANRNYLMAQENFKAALANKAKVMSLELGLESMGVVSKKKTIHGLHNSTLTEAQRNKLRVMSSEFGIDVKHVIQKDDHVKTALEMNREKAMASSECFYGRTEVVPRLDNENFINRNVAEVVESMGDTEGNIERTMEVDEKNEFGENTFSEKVPSIAQDNPSEDQEKQHTLPQTKKSSTLSLDLSTRPQSQQQPFLFELNKLTPMSIDSTPLSEISASISRIPSDATWSMPSTAATNFTDLGFEFQAKPIEYCFRFLDENGAEIVSKDDLKRSQDTVDGLRRNCLPVFLEQSVSMPLAVQMRLVNTELLRYFIEDLQYLKHLESLRNYFLLQDGEFGRNMTEGLFEKLYDADFVVDLINFRTLELLVHQALNSSSKCQENATCISFKINNLPARFNLGDLNVLDCLSLSYRVSWPLNVLLPSDTIGKYDEVFKFLLKLHRISWVQKKIFQELKILAKQVGKNEMYLVSSPQYRKIHQCRHVMTHFIQTFQNYIVGEVLQSNLEKFKANLMNVRNIDELYMAHTTYVKNILYMCLLNSKAMAIRKVFEKIFIVMLKFYDYLRSRSWKIEDGQYIHPNFDKLETIFRNFEDLVLYLFEAGRKIIRTGYQPHLAQLLDMLDHNGYYCYRNTSVSC